MNTDARMKATLNATEDTMTSTYDPEVAITFTSKTTGLDEAVCSKVLLSKDRYEYGFGIMDEDEINTECFGGSPAAIRKLAPLLFPPHEMRQRFLMPANERAFVVLDTGINEQTVRIVLDADELYMRKLGIVQDL